MDTRPIGVFDSGLGGLTAVRQLRRVLHVVHRHRQRRRARASLQIVCRSARGGLITGILLAVARVSGETAPLLFTALWSDAWPKNYFTGPTANLPVLITEYSTNSPFADQHAAGWGAALIVTLMGLALNIATRIVFKEKHHGR